MGSEWRASKILPLIDHMMSILEIKKQRIVILDVGGGAGLILRTVSDYIAKRYGMTVEKLALDLSPGLLDIQKKNNPDLKQALCEDICQTSLQDKEIDLVLMIDVLEHIENPEMALTELRRTSHFVIFKVPLDDALESKIVNTITRKRWRERIIRKFGHINSYNLDRLHEQLEQHTGEVVQSFFTNVYEYGLGTKGISILHRFRYMLAVRVFKISPQLCSRVFCQDFAMVLVKCY